MRKEVPVDEYLACLEKELVAKDLRGGELESLYFGGGTPSRLGGEGLAAAIDLIRRRFDLRAETEVTIEANPDDVSAEDADAWRRAGVNRVSLGIQSFDDAVLAWMHRVHDSGSALTSFEVLRHYGFDNISIDLIFALPKSLGRSWKRDLEIALDLRPDHISLYGLTIEHATPLARWTERGSVLQADEETYAADFLLADSTVRAAGYDHYEVSNFSLGGRRSRHNSAYWTGAPYIGIGPSAHSYDGATRSWNARQYADWVDRLNRGALVLDGSEELTEENRLSEKVYLGLRTSGGLLITERDRQSANVWEREGWATLDGDRVHLTSEGWLRLDSLASALTGL